MKRTLVKARKVKRNVKKLVLNKQVSLIEYFKERLDREVKPLIVLD